MKVQGVKSAERVLAVFELFARERCPLRLKDISAELNLPPSSAMHLLKSLSASGYLSYGRANRKYFPTAKLAEISIWLSDANEMNHFDGILNRLHDETGEFIMLGVMNDLQVHYVKTIRSRHVIQFYSPTGVMRPLVKAGLGWALLSGLADDLIEKIYQQSVYRGVVSKSEWPLLSLQENIGKVRKTGFSVSHGTVHKGASVISIRYPRTINGQHFAIGVSGPTDRLKASLNEVLELLKQHVR